MGNRFYARLYIFGDVKKSLQADLYKELWNDFEYGNGEIEEKEEDESYDKWYKRMRGIYNYLDFSNGEVNYGEFECENFLKENHIQFLKESAGDGGECCAEVIYYDGTTEHAFEANNDGERIMSVSGTINILKLALEMEEECKKGNAPLHINIHPGDPEAGPEKVWMAKYFLDHPNATGVEMALAHIEHEFPKIPNTHEFPPLTFIK